MAKINFLPQQHGFCFPNHFPGLPLPISLPTFPRLKTAYGLCGGMSSAALDFFLFECSIPSQNSVPQAGSLLHRYLYQRQLDTYGFLGSSAAKFGQWMLLNDLELQRRTAEEFNQVLQSLDQGNLVVMGLVYVTFRDTLAIWMNHQVLTYGYETLDSGFIVNIYDPNYPQRNDISLDLKTTPAGLIVTQNIPGFRQKRVRGLFAMPYCPQRPPVNLI